MSELRVFEFRLIVGSARMILGQPRQRFVRVNADGEPDADHAWEIGGDVLEAMEIEDDIFSCWEKRAIEHVIYKIHDIFAGWCEMTIVPV